MIIFSFKAVLGFVAHQDEPKITYWSSHDLVETRRYFFLSTKSWELQSVKEAIRNYYSAGFKKKDIAIVSYHGREKSNLMHLDSLGQTTLRRFSGGYDLFGQPVFTDGEILLESVYRFKGQAAPAIIFTEIDFEMLDDKAIRKLFVGATRSMMKLILIIHERSAVKLLERLG